ncbi:MAG: outer membrane beta-barrel protein [Gemmatimonadota bacterium]
MKILRLFTLAAVVAGVMALPAGAQVEFEVTPFAGGTFYLADLPNQFSLHRGSASDLIVHDGKFGDAWTLGLNAGFRIREAWALEGMFAWLPTNLSATSGLTGVEDLNAYMYGLTGLYYLPVDWRIQPFVGLGAGAETYAYNRSGLEGHTDLMGNVVGGLYASVTDMVGLRLEARDCFARFESGVQSVDNAWENDLMVTLGLSFRTRLGG